MPDNTLLGEYKENDPNTLINELFSGKLTIDNALQRLRTRLLDLSPRNRLLNYRHPKGRSVQFVDVPNLNSLFHRLLDNKDVIVSPVPEPEPLLYEGRRPDAKQHAENHCGINTAYQFPKSSSNSRGPRKIQALYYPPELEKLLRKIAREARAAIEETGTNMLFLMFGFLEFYERDDSEKPLLAPLLTMPVALNKGEIDANFRTYQYAISYNGDDLSENLTLREKLRQDFLLNLPELDDDDEPEAYFAKIEGAIKKKKRWALKRQLTLGMLFFGKLAIWSDLDTSKWPILSNHPLVRMIFEGGNSGDGTFFAEDYNIDEHPKVNIPLVFDADSSQHSAIIDALSGKNIVINGPPGTGKSQTISNLIAIALSEGKTVLFVSEKLAALEVVRRRLTRAHLGSFCLELHSHKTQKKRLLEDLRERIEQKFPYPSILPAKIKSLNSHKQKLKRYAELMGSCLQNALGLTVNEIFWAADRRRQELGDSANLLYSITIREADRLTYDDIKQKRTKLEVLARLYEAVGYFDSSHPWSGFVPNSLKPGDEGAIAHILQGAIDEAERLDNLANEYIGTIGEKEQPPIQVLGVLADNVQKIPAVPEKIVDTLLPRFFSNSDPQGALSVGILLTLTDKMSKVRTSLNYASSVLEAGYTFVVEDARKLKKAVDSTLLPDVLNSSISDIDAWKTALDVAIMNFRDALSLVKPTQCHAVESSLSSLDAKLGTLASMNILDSNLSDLESTAQEILRETRTLQAALEKVEEILRKREIAFDGSSETLQKLANDYGLAELRLHSMLNPEIIEETRKVASIELAYLPTQDLQQIHEKLCSLPDYFRAAFDRLKSTAYMLGLEFDGSLNAVENLRALVKVATSHPRELISHRRPSFVSPRMPELVEKAENQLALELRMRGELHAIFHLDMLPSADDLRQSIGALRRGDSMFCYFDGEWRRARKLFRSIAKDGRKTKPSESAEALSKVVAWVECRDNFCDNKDFQNAFGSLYQGLETDCRKIRMLYEWYTESYSELLRCPGLINKINLTTIDANVLGQLAARDKEIDSDIVALSEGDQFIRSTIGVHVSSLREAKPRGWPQYIDALDNFLKDLKGAISFLPQIAEPSISPKRTLDLIEARQELNAASGEIACLLRGPQTLRNADKGFLGFDRLVGTDITRESLEVIRDTCSNILSLVEYLDSFANKSCSPAAVRNFIRAKLELDRVQQDIAPWRNFFSWIDYLENAELLLSQIQHLSQYFSPFIKPEKSINEAFEAVFADAEAKGIIDSLAQDKEVTNLLGPGFKGIDTDVLALWQTHEWGSAVVKLAFPASFCDWLLKPGVEDNFARAKHLFEDMSETLRRLREQLAWLGHYGTFDWDTWQQCIRSNEKLDFPEEIKLRLKVALENLDAILPWSQYHIIRSECIDNGLEVFCPLLESETIFPATIPASFEFAVYQSIGKCIYQAWPELSRFTRIAHENIRVNYQTLDRQIIDLSGKALAHTIDSKKQVPEGQTGARIGDLTELQLIKRELGKTRRHVPIRKLIKKAGRALLAYKPCFMMSPLSVAQYLEHGAIQFDLVVMDEASQLKPEEALGAVARGGQLVVVGDPKQLPPTSFFERMIESGSDEDDEEDEPVALQGTESILDICQQLFYPMRTLRWHYRSHHESLIAFSNHYFYKNLIVFPSPYIKDSRMGVRFRYVKNGMYKDRQNLPEAQRVIDAIAEHMLKHSEESLGVVTLNQTQRDLIEELLDRKLRVFDEGQKFLKHWEEQGWPFFVKNLENVQGDERDVIFISATFGKAAGTARVRQNFGPISRPNGWRRLNVLFTRSRRRIELFTSMMPEDIIVDEKTPLGTQAFRNYLDFAKNGILSGSDPGTGSRDPDSDFEIAVAQILREKGYQVTPQLGVAGFFIDIAVHNPDKPGEFLAAIECDGATYHSGFSVRDRDRIRQEILESLGWKDRIYRIWSTDWFFNRVDAIKRLLSFLEMRRIASRSEESREYEVAETIEEDILESPPLEEKVFDLPAFQSDEDLFVEVGDQVTYFFTNNPQNKHKVHIIEGPSDPKRHIVNEKTPLAQALMGLSLGEENELKVQGNQSRTLRVLKILRA